MKKVLLTGVAFVALATTPAMAEGLSLDLAGHFKGYGVYNDNDEAAGVSLDDLNIRKETEVHFTGETTLDSGLTVGVHVEADVDGDDDFGFDETYMYLSGGWGRVNFGEEDGAAYLLQVAAPSADSNVDGLRQYISTYNPLGGATGGLNATQTAIFGAPALGQSFRLDYDHVAPTGAGNASGKNNKLTYMTPVFNGFQAGASYIPTMDDDANGFVGTGADNDANEYEDGYELAMRYEGAYEGVGVTFGAGYGKYNVEVTTDTVAAGELTDDSDVWNVGLDLDFAGFGLGVAYLENNSEVDAIDVEQETLVVGADYQMGAYKLGVSWLNTEAEAANLDAEVDRYTAGASYSYGPGMSFRGSVSMIDGDDAFADSTQVTLGTQVNF